MWHMSSHSGVATLRTAIHLLLIYLQHQSQMKPVTVYRQISFFRFFAPMPLAYIMPRGEEGTDE